MTTQAQPEWKERSAPSVEASPSAYGGFSGQYIRGEFRPGRSSQTWEDRDPFTSKLLARLALADKRDLEDAYRSAAEAQIAWAQSRPAERGAIFLAAVRVLDSRREELLNWLIKEAGSTRQKATAELSFVRGNMLWASTLAYRTAGRILPIDIPGKESRVYRRPLGVIGVISPWNFPMVLSNRSIAPALALGNAVVVKPADDTPITGGLLLAKIYQEAGLPAGLLNIVVGEVSEIGDAFTLNPTPKLISFTGSTRVGKRIGELAIVPARTAHVTSSRVRHVA